jgi:hypothetical protein
VTVSARPVFSGAYGPGLPASTAYAAYQAAQRTWSFSRSMTTRVDSATNALPQINRLNDLIGFQNAG